MNRNMISRENGQILITVVVATMILTPFILKNLNKIANRFESKVEKLEDETHKIQIPPMKNHIIVAGYGRIGQEIVLRLKDQGLLYVVAESDLELVDLGKSRGENIYFVNMMQKTAIKELYAQDASVIILTIANQQRLEIVAGLLNSLDLKASIIVMHTGADTTSELQDEYGENFIFVKKERVVANALLQEALKCKLTQ